MTGVRCKIDPDNCQDAADVDDPGAWLTTHLLTKHPTPTQLAELEAAAPIRQPDGVVWETLALSALERLARTGREFTIYEAQDYGVADPPDPRHGWGSLAKKARHLGIIEPVTHDDGSHKAVESKRPGTKASMVKVWRGTARQRRHQPAARRSA